MSWVIIIVVAGLLLLTIPLPEQNAPPASDPHRAFRWNDDERWAQLEADFAHAREAGCDTRAAEIERRFGEVEAALAELEAAGAGALDPGWAALQNTFFSLAADVAACPARAVEFAGLGSRMRSMVKALSRDWALDEQAQKDALYRLLAGVRMALEEVMSQSRDAALAMIEGIDEAPSTPSTTIEGIRVYSGDMIASRGGAAVSALIARGSDHPGQFSHVALVHVSEQGEASLIEAHIERGVAVSTFDEYLADKKLRLLHMRLRGDHPALAATPDLPHRAAQHALRRAQTEHIPYDFAMDSDDPSKLFCSEVASDAYGVNGVSLWKHRSTISTQGIRNWLYAFGVRHFVTEEPSDLEYDPQVHVVAEWRDPDILMKARVDNAVVEAMLERAERGEAPPYAWYQLPVARLAKLYSVALNAFGKVGPIPEGMSGLAALRVNTMGARHTRFAEETLRRAQRYRMARGYEAPYWELVRIAAEVVDAAS